jgi:hypothetical protein
LLNIRGAKFSSATFVALTISAYLASSASSDTRNITQFVAKGQRMAVWGTLCKSTFCSDGICFELKSKSGEPASAKIAVETSLHKTVNSEATGHFCSETKWMTYFMVMTVFVEPTQEDLYVSYNTFVDQ